VDWRVLKGVSRSFYLTLRLLPEPVREPIALAYLLARATDTIADVGTLPVEVRVSALEAMLGEKWSCVHAETIAAACDGEADRRLIEGLATALEELSVSPDADLIRRVWRTIGEGQLFDLVRFAEVGAPPLNAEERDRYTYLVAGCVGEFWTDICLRKFGDLSDRPAGELREDGVRYGKALQLVNILRDRSADRAIGRVYVGDGETAGVVAETFAYLEAAGRFVASLKHGSLRYATALPALLAGPTLREIVRRPEAPRVRISRSAVYGIVASSFPILFSRRWTTEAMSRAVRR